MPQQARIGVITITPISTPCSLQLGASGLQGEPTRHEAKRSSLHRPGHTLPAVYEACELKRAMPAAWQRFAVWRCLHWPRSQRGRAERARVRQATKVELFLNL